MKYCNCRSVYFISVFRGHCVRCGNRYLYDYYLNNSGKFEGELIYLR